MLLYTSDAPINATNVGRERHGPEPQHVTTAFILATINRNVDAAGNPTKNTTNIEYQQTITSPQSRWRHPKGLLLRTTHGV